MSDVVLETMDKPDGGKRIVVVRRADGRYSFRAQFPTEDGWGPMGPYLGIYDSAETAKWEALGKIDWIAGTQARN